MSIIKRMVYKILDYRLAWSDKYSKMVSLKDANIKNLKIILNKDKLLQLLPKNAIVAELGVDNGDFSEKIETLTNPKKLYLIDIWKTKRYNKNKMNQVKKRFENEIKLGKISVIKGKSDKEITKFDDNYFDWVYIDTTHSYLQTIKELEICRSKVKKDGIIAGHDYSKGNINRGLPYGVVLAVNEFCIKFSWEFIYLTHETHRNLSYAIRKIK